MADGQEIDQKIEQKVEERVNAAFARMYPSGMEALKAPAKQELTGMVPPLLSAPRPMPPAPPSPLPWPNARGVLATQGLVERPKTEYAKELEAKAAEPKAPLRLCPECGGVKRVNTQYNRKSEIIGYDPCPRCVEV
jgi:hypothetical protein